jgi:hypothetical protein
MLTAILAVIGGILVLNVAILAVLFIFAGIETWQSRRKY